VVHANVVPATAFGFVMLMVVVAPLQMVCATGVTAASGIGLTVTSTVMAVPGHAFADGTMVYLTMAKVLVVLVSVWAILFPVPLLKPPAVPLNGVAVHAKVVPATLFGLLMLIEVVAPLQMVWLAGVASTFGIGFTVTSTVMGIPGHPLADGVMVYLTTAGILVAFDRVCPMSAPAPLENPVGVPL
jgi:hypothetical protein